MFTIEKYLLNISKLTNSLVIKLNAIGKNNNIALPLNNLEHEYIPRADNKHLWKYYLNLSGKYHPLDKKVTIKVIETEKEEILTPELLEQNSLTKEMLLRCDDYYNELITLNKESFNYIHGCMYNIDIDKAINAPDGTILSYNKNFLADNELYIIRELEIFIKNFLNRWYIEAYALVDELYVSAFIATLYSSIFLKIINLHLTKINTNEVNEFYLEHFFRSKLNLWENIQVLNNESKFWLYKNLNSLIANTGKNSNFDKIVYKLFEMNEVGIGEYILQKKDPEILKDYSDLREVYFKRSEPLFVSKKLNKYYITNDGVTSSIDSLIDSQLTKVSDVKNKLPVHMRNYVSEITNLEIKNKSFSIEKTKTLDIDSVTLFKAASLDLFGLIIDYWCHVISEDYFKVSKVEYPGNVNITNNDNNEGFENDIKEFSNDDNKIYRVNPRVGLLMLLKLMLFSTGSLDHKITKINYRKILITDKKYFQYLIDEKLFKDGYSRHLLKELKNVLPHDLVNINTVEDFGTYLNKVINYYELLWVLACNCENFIVSANLKHLFNYITTEGELEISKEGKTIDELLALENVHFPVSNNTDIVKSIKLIIKTFTNIELDQDDKLIENIEHYITIIKKLTSYSVQAVNSNTLTKTIPIFYNNITTLKTKEGLIMLYGMDVRGLEENRSLLESNSVLYNDLVYKNSINFHPYLAKSELKPLQGIMEIDNNKAFNPVLNMHHININKRPYFGFENYKWFDNFLKVNSIDIKGLETKELETKSLSRYSSAQDAKSFTINKTPFISLRKKLKGMMFITEGKWLSDFMFINLNNLPVTWLTEEFINFLTISGMNIKALEDKSGTNIFKHNSIESRANKINTITPIVNKVKDLNGLTLLEEDRLIQYPIVGIPYKNTIYNINSFKDKTKYIKVASITFENLDKKPGLKTVVLNGGFYKRDENDNMIEMEVRVNKISDIHPEIRDIKATGLNVSDNINKEFLVGLSSLIYNVDGKDSRISYIGLEDEEGNIDRYKTKDIPLVDKDNIGIIPHLDINNQIVSARSTVFPKEGTEIISDIYTINETDIKEPTLLETKLDLLNQPKMKVTDNKPRVTSFDIDALNKPKINKK